MQRYHLKQQNNWDFLQLKTVKMCYCIDGDNVIFPKHGFVFHYSFAEAYRNYSTIETRRKLKKYYTKSQQNDIIHYLKEQKYITI